MSRNPNLKPIKLKPWWPFFLAGFTLGLLVFWLLTRIWP